MKRLVPVAALLLGLAVVYWPTLSSGGALMQTDLGDTRLVHFILEHGWRWVHGAPGGYWDLPMFYPDGAGTLTWAENFTAVAPLYWALRAVGFGEDLAFQLWLPLLTSFNFVAFYVLLRRPLAFERFASSVGAWLFAFAALRTNQMGHQQLMPVFFSAWTVHALVRLAQTSRWRWAPLAGLAAGGQLLASVYLGWFLLFGLALYGAAWMFQARRWALVPRLALSTGVAALLFAPVLLRYRETSFHWTYGDAAPYVARWKDLVNFGPSSWLFSASAQTGYTEIEHRLALGLVTVGAAALGLVRAKRWELLGASAALLVLATMCWPVVWRVFPGADGVRTPCRVLELLLFPVAIGLAYLATELPRMPRELWALVLAAVFLEQGVTTLSFDKTENRNRIAAIVQAIPEGCEAFAYGSDHPTRRMEHYQLDAMWAALESGVPTLNGYSGHRPLGWPVEQTKRIGKLCVLEETEPMTADASGRTE